MPRLFKAADPSLTDTHYFGEDDGTERDWIRVRSSLSKSETNAILKAAPMQDRDIEGGLAFLERFFAKVVVDWSFEDAEGNRVAPNVESWREMDSVGANQIQDFLSKHLQKVMGREVEKLEGESSN